MIDFFLINVLRYKYLYIYLSITNKINMKLTRSIEEMDKEFAQESGMTYEAFKSLPLLKQSEIKRKITNNRLKK